MTNRDATGRLRILGCLRCPVLILLVIISLQAALADSAAEAKPDGFDTALVGDVLGAALAFMAPRILDPVPVPELAAWGLGGVAALDPSLNAGTDAASLKLTEQIGSAPAVTVWQQPAPAGDDPYAWGRAVAAACGAAWSQSAAVRSFGQQAVLQSIFDELFNHLDPYSRYVAPAPADEDRDRRQGGGGVGAAVVAGNGGLTFEDVSPEGPAAAAGIVDGTRLLAIDGKPVGDATPNAASALLAGDVGSEVRVRARLPHGRVRDLALTRAFIPPLTVSGTSIGKLLVVKVTSFARDTAEEISGLLDEGVRRFHPSGIVLDLRGNRGGLLQQAVTTAALVLNNGVAVTTEGRFAQSNHVWSVQGGDITNGLPLVVLVDGRTASAAEILAAALADHRRAVVEGSSTLGKGLVQTILQLPDGGELFVTWSRVLAPLGWPIQGLGVLPQLCTSRGSDEVGLQMQALDSGTSELTRALREERGARAPLPIARILEIRDACPAAIGTDEDLDAARTLLSDTTAYQSAIDSIPRLP